MNQKLLFLFCIILFFCLCLFTLTAYGENSADGFAVQDVVAAQGSIPTLPEIKNNAARHPALDKWLHLYDKNEIEAIEEGSVIGFAPKVPADLARILISAGGEKGGAGLWYVFLVTIVSIGAGFLSGFGAKYLLKKRFPQRELKTPPDDDNLARFLIGLFRAVPALINLVLLALVSSFVFLFFSESLTVEGGMLFQLILGAILVTTASAILSRIIFSPGDAKVRPFALDDSVAKTVSSAFVTLATFIFSGGLFLYCITDLGALEQTVSWVSIVLGSILIAVFSSQVLNLKVPIANSLKKGFKKRRSNWIRVHLAAYWHVPALIYLLIVWLIWIGQELTGLRVRNGSFLVSLFIVPIYIAVSYTGQAIIRSVIDSLRSDPQADPGHLMSEDEEIAEQERTHRKKALESRICVIFRIVLVGTITIWTLTLWGYGIPFAGRAILALFESLVTLGLALIVWRLASSFIERKIEEVTPDRMESTDGDNNEFGGGEAPAGRSQTLLPLLRKVLASTLVVMVSLIVLSSLGLNIAPLLAGAGVVGLAVGFGAQKLVSDILSGFFFLLDDAFRVGEYIQTGSIRGTVEAITLRNVMLRHHLGMLQVVPHSDLGAVTNFMRGGIVIKFPLEFSYDTDIEKVRKIIKRVGQEMIEDEEIGADFIQPLKSQGVYQIANSVMVIRVKFTAKPGKQFVIKREAFRRLTEAFNSKGIYYAHRKVIVDFPKDEHQGDIDEETRTKIFEAGAAAAITAEIDQQQAEAEKQEEER